MCVLLSFERALPLEIIEVGGPWAPFSRSAHVRFLRSLVALLYGVMDLLSPGAFYGLGKVALLYDAMGTL